MAFLGWALCFCAIILIIAAFTSEKEWKFSLFHGLAAALVILSFAVILYSEIQPSAMEVYQGKTTLEYTYRDGVPIDSVVVYKPLTKCCK